MPTAKAIAPDGKVLAEFRRPRGDRARLSTKTHQIRHRRLTETEFEQVYTYPAGTRIVCDDGQPDEVWDGKQWTTTQAAQAPAPSSSGGDGWSLRED